MGQNACGRLPKNGAECLLPLAAKWGSSVIAVSRKMGLKGRCCEPQIEARSFLPQNETFSFDLKTSYDQCCKSVVIRQLRGTAKLPDEMKCF